MGAANFSPTAMVPTTQTARAAFAKALRPRTREGFRRAVRRAFLCFFGGIGLSEPRTELEEDTSNQAMGSFQQRSSPEIAGPLASGKVATHVHPATLPFCLATSLGSSVPFREG